ncbi:hypothetical protein CGLO_13829 [Colletotrichum gloeosporioides Cg-14]|uniref:Uncharacterized protein n=1 Tax=Colletotrichum gloeosporioides (strain Cg-14) TaxID=1237896 RepID=T0K2W0_COLGC|nr:hypothetical protein CGLO_13829 [Colletotrichum gloeosporioides Cg-14]
MDTAIERLQKKQKNQ